MSKWIKSIEQLPPLAEGKSESSNVIVRNESGNIGIGTFRPEYGWLATWYNKGESYIGLAIVPNVSEWQPIAD